MPTSYQFHSNAYCPLPDRAPARVPGLNASAMSDRVAPIGHTPWRVDPRRKLQPAARLDPRPTGGSMRDRGNPGNPRRKKSRPAPTTPSAATLHAMWARGTLEI